ncbi:helix-turn-helix domain-containing protein [Streptomyces sp900129855]|uniref:Helix-turn-helix domain-containing protein n=1 Tax=Streptomyces sp. 900129855 TaxID=3155129 RepID=A0ABV2ZLF9_9ACTN
MSIEAMAWAFKRDIPNPGAKLLLLALCDFADESWSCFPGQETLAVKTSQSLSTVRRHLKWLEQQGYVTRSERFVEGRRTSNRYAIRTPPPTGPPPASNVSAAPDEPPGQVGHEDAEDTEGDDPTASDTGAEQAVKMTGGQNDLRSEATGVPVNLTGEPSGNHQINNPLPPAVGEAGGGADVARAEPSPDELDRDVGAVEGGCTAHPHGRAANCRGCGTNPRVRRAAAGRRQAAEREHQDTQLWLQALRVRREQVERQQRAGTLDGARRAAREAAREGARRAGRGEEPPSADDMETLTVIDQD